MEGQRNRLEPGRRRGRPRLREPAPGLVRRNLLVDPEALDRLCLLYGTTSESEAVRRVVALALLAEEGRALGDWLSAHGGPVDGCGPPPLPVYLTPGDVPDDDDDPAG